MPRHFTRFLAMCGCSLLFSLAVVTSVRAVDLLPYQADGWRYLQVSPGNPVEGLFMAPGFDDSAWNTGRAAFSSGSNGGCPVDATAHTFWLAYTNMLVRRSFLATAASALILHIGIDNDLKIWLNGTLFYTTVHEGCAALDEFNVPVPAGFLVDGMNSIAIQAVDRGGSTFFDMRIESLQPTPIRSDTWARVKAIYR